MHRKIRRPAHCEPGAMADNTQEMAERLRLSRERLMASDLKGTTRAWRLWAACVDATVGYTREADQTYVVGLAKRAGMERQVASQLLQRFNELGVFAWASGPRGSHTPGMLALPSGGHSGTMSRPAQGVKVTPLHSNDSMRVESLSDAVSIDTGTHHSSPSLIGPQDSVDGSGDWEAERRANSEARPKPQPFDTEKLARQLEAELGEPDLAERFPPYHGDERTGDGVGDDEASQLRWQGANPSKARARRAATTDEGEA
jgi:hypothetical protein